jgi:hypothetical protein
MAASLLFGTFPAQLLASEAAPAAVEPLESVLITQVDAWVTLNPDGGVIDFQTDAKLLPALQVNLERIVRNWRFEPFLIEGQRRDARAKTRIVLAATKVGDAYTVKVDNVTFPNEAADAAGTTDLSSEPITADNLRPPNYPTGLLQAGVSGEVLLCIRVGADGRAEQVIARQTMLYDVKGKDHILREAIGLFEQSAVHRAKGWRFNVSAARGRMPVEERTVYVPVEFMIGRKPVVQKPGMWRTIVRVPKRQADWLPASSDAQNAGVADVAAGEVLSFSSLVKLDTDVVGMVVM